MSRPLRIQFPGALYHVTSRGNRRSMIFVDDEDRALFLRILAQAMDRFDAQVLAYCLMGNHYHLVLHTRSGNLALVMRHINGVYSQAHNRRHGLVGHVFQGRFKAIFVDRDAYLMTLCRYVERNPVAAGLVAEAGDWPWSSYRAHAGLVPAPAWLDTEALHGHLLGRAPASPVDHEQATDQYVLLVMQSQAEDGRFWQQGLQGQVFLGDAEFAERMRAQAQGPQLQAKDIPKAQRHSRGTLADALKLHPDRAAALAHGHRVFGLSMSEMARELGLSVSRVSRLIGGWEKGRQAPGRAG